MVVALYALFLLVLVGVTEWAVFAAPGTVPPWLLPALAPVLLLAAPGYLMVATRRLRLAVTIEPSELTVRCGSSTTVVKRAAVGRVVVRHDLVILFGIDQRRPVARLRTRRRRDEVVSRFATSGWPLENDRDASARVLPIPKCVETPGPQSEKPR
ncbi:MAG: YqeB family protein, partial [Stackebrandtia sp.]